MAELFLARAVGVADFQKIVVLKRILPAYSRDADFVRMFLEEARLAATLHHPNIVQVYDIGEAAGTYFFTMELVQGLDLHQLWQSLERGPDRIPLQLALGIILDLASGLHYAHEKVGEDGLPLGLVHRDVSPANVLVSFDGTAKLADFGIAKATGTAGGTRPGSLKGNVRYMSPEQCAGARLDRRSDVFSLGILLYELTTQKFLFRGATEIATLRQITDGDIPRPSAVVEGYPAGLEAIVLRALERDPDQRYASAEQVQLDLEAFAHDHGLLVSRVASARFMQRFRTPAEDEDEHRAGTIALEGAKADGLPAAARPRRAWVPALLALSTVALGFGAWMAWRMLHPAAQVVQHREDTAAPRMQPVPHPDPEVTPLPKQPVVERDPTPPAAPAKKRASAAIKPKRRRARPIRGKEENGGYDDRVPVFPQ